MGAAPAFAPRVPTDAAHELLARSRRYGAALPGARHRRRIAPRIPPRSRLESEELARRNASS
jgi:hypothetical protein